MTAFQLPSGRHTAAHRAAQERVGLGVVLPLVAFLVLMWLAAAVQFLPSGAGVSDRPVPVPAAQAAPRPPAPGR